MLAILLCLLAPLAAAQDRGFDSGGVRIRYVDHGGGAAVLLIHGFTADLERSWVETGILPDLARDHRVIAFDLRGHGGSDKPHETRAYDEVALDAIRLLDNLAIDKAHVVGYALGGAAYRRSRSERSDREADAAAREIEAGIYRALLVSTAPIDEPSLKEADILARSAEIAGRNDQRALAALMRARRALVVTDAEIATVRVPSLAVVGAADPALPRVKAMQAVWPGLEVIELPGATHPTVHPRSLPRHAAFREAIRAHIARAKHRPHI